MQRDFNENSETITINFEDCIFEEYAEMTTVYVDPLSDDVVYLSAGRITCDQEYKLCNITYLHTIAEKEYKFTIEE